MNTYDYIIIGGGSAGCVLADKLSACGNYDVLLLEAGRKDSSPLVKTPLGIVELIKRKAHNWLLESEPESSQNNRKIFNPRGKVLGGSSSINAMLYIRGQKEDYNHWVELGNEGWSYDEVLPYFKATQNQERGESEYHGVGGPLNVADVRSKLSACQDFIKAALQAGYKTNDDFNGAEQEGIGFLQVTQKNGQRHSSADAFLTPNLHRENLTVITHAQVRRVIIDHHTAKGVEAVVDGRDQTFIATKETILSAGAFHSPQILMLSGVGEKAVLKQHNIKVHHDLPGVGKNLQEHVDALVVSKYKRHDVLAYRPIAGLHFIKGALNYLFKRHGVLASPVSEAGGFIKSDEALKRPDLQIHCIPAAMDDHGRNNKMLMNYGMAMHTCLLRPKSRGSVTLHNNNIDSPPKIQLNMLSHPDDMEIMVKGVKICREIYKQSALAEHKGDELIPGDHCQSDEEIKEFLRNKANNIYHPVGTCKMGSDELAVVNSQLRVHGIDKLRVVDASIMPTVVSGNTNAPTIMIAAKAADLILSKS